MLVSENKFQEEKNVNGTRDPNPHGKSHQKLPLFWNASLRYIETDRVSVKTELHFGLFLINLSIRMEFL